MVLFRDEILRSPVSDHDERLLLGLLNHVILDQIQMERDGDVIELDVPARRLTLQVSDEEIDRRRAAWTPRDAPYPRGFGRMYAQHVTQANLGCDFDFLEGTAPIEEPEIH